MATRRSAVPWQPIPLDGIELMTGEEFQLWIAELFSRAGYVISFAKLRQPATYHLAATRGGERALICVAHRLLPVGSDFVYRLIWARDEVHGSNRLIAVAPAGFKANARALARKGPVELWAIQELRSFVAG